MKKIFTITFALAALLAASCHQPELIKPTTIALGFNSVSASYISGDLADDPSAVFTATVTSLEEDIVIVFPRFYPKDSDNMLTDITKMKVTADIDYNCNISPALTLLDLTQRNEFVFTDGRGDKHNICIRGEIRNLWEKQLIAFSIIDPELTTIIDEANKTVSVMIPSKDIDISSCTVDYTLSPHASCNLDGMEKVNLNEIESIVVTADDGTTSEYTLILSDISLPKIPYGFRESSVEMLWNMDIVSTFGVERSADNNTSLAVLGSHLVVSFGNGTVPFYVNRSTGSVGGNINIGSAEPTGIIKNDDAGNLLICNYTSSQFRIWKTTSVEEAPTLLLSYDYATGYPLGFKLAVQGDINGNALIVAPFEATDASATNELVYWTITDGVVSSPTNVNLSGFIGVGWAEGHWGTAPGSIPAIVPFSSSLEEGMLFCMYDENQLYHIGGDFSMTLLLGPEANSGNYNANSIDIKKFNNATYAALLMSGHFPQWGGVPILYVYDVTNLSNVTGNLDSSPSMALSYTGASYYTDGNGVAACSDVVLYPSKDGYYLNLYYIDHNNRIIEAFQCDCIEQ